MGARKMAQPQGLTIPELRQLTGLPEYTCAWKGTKTDPGWPASGIQIIGSEHVSIIAHHNWDLSDFQGYNYKAFHYCPRGPWDDWVKLAKKILEVDKVVRQYRDAAHITRI